jgi:hypothetical protein
LLISYNSQLLQEVCYKHASAVQYLGEEIADYLHDRHADLLAVDNVLELPIGEISIAQNLCTLAYKGVLSIRMVPNYVTGALAEVYDWSTVERVKLMAINNVE